MINLIRSLTPRALRNWVRQPRRSAYYVLDRIAHALGRSCNVKLRPDWSVRCHPASREHFRVFNTDPAQGAELDVFIRHCAPGMQFLDVGAHYGLFGLAAQHFGGGGVRAVCVEASPRAAAILKANLKANQAADVTLLNVAMGRIDGTLQMLSTGPAGSDYFVSVPEGRADTVTVRQLSLSTVLKETGLRPTHLKLDVEGFEDDVIGGAVSVLKHYQPLLFLELHGKFLRARHRDPSAVIRQLRECGYHRMEEEGTVLNDEAIANRGYECRLVCFPSRVLAQPFASLASAI